MSWANAVIAGANLAGSLFGGGGSGNDAADAAAIQAEQNRLNQREFAEHAIRWRVADAKAAGIHPLYALGANLPTYSPNPIVVGPGGEDNTAASFLDFGQNLARSIDSTRTGSERLEARLGSLAVERGELENDLLRAQIALLGSSQVGPAMPESLSTASLPSAVPPGGSKVGSVVVPHEITATGPERPSHAAGVQPQTTWVRTDTGFQPVPHREAFEDADIGNPAALTWYWRNQALPTLGISGSSPPPDSYLPPDAVGWRWSPGMQEWQPAKEFDFVDRTFYGVPRGGSTKRGRWPFN